MCFHFIFEKICNFMETNYLPISHYHEYIWNTVCFSLNDCMKWYHQWWHVFGEALQFLSIWYFFSSQSKLLFISKKFMNNFFFNKSFNPCTWYLCYNSAEKMSHIWYKDKAKKRQFLDLIFIIPFWSVMNI